MFTESEAIIFTANPNFQVSNQSTTSLLQRHFQKNTRTIKREGDSRTMNETESGNKSLFSGLREYPNILLQRLEKTRNILSQDMCSYQDSNRAPPKCKPALLTSQRTCSIEFLKAQKCNGSQETSVAITLCHMITKYNKFGIIEGTETVLKCQSPLS